MNTKLCKQPVNLDIKVWRYLDIPKLIYILHTGKLYLTRLDLLHDPHEGSVTRAMQLKNERYSKGIPNLHNEIIKFNRRLRTMTYVNCWTMNDEESEAMWKLYCPNNQGVAVQTTYRKLADSIEGDQPLIGAVDYIDHFSEGPEAEKYLPMMTKRKAFSHENEVRIIALDYINKDVEMPAGKTLAWNVGCIEKVYVNPYSSEWYFDVIKATLHAFRRQDTPIEWSKMRSEPLY